MNFKGFGDTPSMDGIGLKPLGNFPLARQSSIYSMTFDELQNMGGLGKDFGSMNMDDLLKNIWTAEETQAMMTASAAAGEGSGPSGNLQRQGSLTLPRTLSQKTVDEVWKDLMKGSSGVKDGSSGGLGQNLPQRQQTLGEMTLEEFLARAGVVREDLQQQIGIPTGGGFFGDLSQQSNNTSLALGFQQTNQNNGLLDTNNSVLNQPPRLALNMGDVKSMQQRQPPQQQQQQQPQLPFPKQANVAFASSIHSLNTTQLATPGARGSMVGIGDPPLNNKLVQSSGLQNGLQNGGMGIVGLGSPAGKISPGVVPKSNMDHSSLSPVPNMFGRGRKCSPALEKVVERRQRRMIKNRESAARSRARKQAYTLELEAEVAKLKELNEELQRKQEEMMEMQNNQILEKLHLPLGGKRQCLRRTLTGPW